MPRLKKHLKRLLDNPEAMEIQQLLDKAKVRISELEKELRWQQLLAKTAENSLKWAASLSAKFAQTSRAVDWHIGRVAVERNQEGLRELDLLRRDKAARLEHDAYQRQLRAAKETASDGVS